MLLHALAALRARQAPVLWLVGDGPCRARYAREAQRLGLADRVKFLGYRYDIPELVAAADVAVLTSLKEGIPRALMEAMAVGVPARLHHFLHLRPIEQAHPAVSAGDCQVLAVRRRPAYDCGTVCRHNGVVEGKQQRSADADAVKQHRQLRVSGETLSHNAGSIPRFPRRSRAVASYPSPHIAGVALRRV